MTTQRSVLLVDDEPSVHKVFERLFTKMGYVMTAEVTGDAGAQRIAERPFDVYLLDKNLPNAGGELLAKAARATTPNGVIILITGHGTEASAAGLVGIADEYLIKPFDIDDVRRTVNALVEQRASSAPAEAYSGSTSSVVVTPPPSRAPGPRTVRPEGDLPWVHVVSDRQVEVDQLVDICKHLDAVCTFAAELPETVPDVLVLSGGLCSFELRRKVWTWQADGKVPVVLLQDAGSMSDAAAAVALKAELRLVRPLNLAHAHVAMQRALSQRPMTV